MSRETCGHVEHKHLLCGPQALCAHNLSPLLVLVQSLAYQGRKVAYAGMDERKLRPCVLHSQAGDILYALG